MKNVLLILLAYFFMEFVAWFTHKYVMHGFLWKWHKDHHINDLKPEQKKTGAHFIWEKNDLFFLVFAIPAASLMISGFLAGIFPLVFISIGITLYGFTYFILHEIVYHRRMRIPLLQNKHGKYIRAIVRAHRAHHHPKNRSGFNSFGLLFFPAKYMKE